MPVGGSMGAKAMAMTGGIAKRVTGGLRAGSRYAGRTANTMGGRSTMRGNALIGAGRAMKLGSKYPRTTMGIGAAGAAGMMSNRRGSQNYPMY